MKESGHMAVVTGYNGRGEVLVVEPERNSLLKEHSSNLEEKPHSRDSNSASGHTVMVI